VDIALEIKTKTKITGSSIFKIREKSPVENRTEIGLLVLFLKTTHPSEGNFRPHCGACPMAIEHVDHRQRRRPRKAVGFLKVAVLSPVERNIGP
jgi:hypothetical protein